jgi:serine/threonine protein kinase
MGLPIIDEYVLTRPWDNPGAGTSVWAFAKKNGKEYFIKEFPAPTFPIANDLSPQLIEKKEERCFRFYVQKKSLYDEIAKCGDTNFIGMQELFLYSSKYYLVTEKVTESRVTMEQLAKLPEKHMLQLLLAIANSLNHLHQRHIIHGDIKPSNVLLQTNGRGGYTPKIIDFDAGYLEGQQPTADLIVFDPAYVAPETLQYVSGDDVRLTTKIDVFAAGILFHQYMTGKAPIFETDESANAFDNETESLLPKLSDKLSSEMKSLIWSMLIADPEIRISMSQVVERLDLILNPPPPPPPEDPPQDPSAKDDPNGSGEVSPKLISTFGRKKPTCASVEKKAE